MPSNLSLIFTNLVNQLTQLEKIIKRTTIQEIAFNEYLESVKKFEIQFFQYSPFENFVESESIKNQLKNILKQRIQKFEKISLVSFDQQKSKCNTNSSAASFDSDQSLRCLLKRQVMLLKAIQVKIVDLQQKTNGNKQNVNQNLNIAQKKSCSQLEDSILHNLIHENMRLDSIIKYNLKRKDIGLNLIKQISQIQEDLKQHIIYCYYQCFKKCQLQTNKTIHNIISIIQKFISVKPTPQPMFEFNTSYAISENTQKKSVLTERIHKKTSESCVQIFIKDFNDEQEIKPSLKKDFDLQCRNKQKKAVKNVVCYNGCSIF